MDPKETPLPHNCPLSLHRFPGLQRKATGLPGKCSHSSSYLLSLAFGPGGHWSRCSRHMCRFAPSEPVRESPEGPPWPPMQFLRLLHPQQLTSGEQPVPGPLHVCDWSPVHAVLPQKYRGSWDARPPSPAGPAHAALQPRPTLGTSLSTDARVHDKLL